VNIDLLLISTVADKGDGVVDDVVLLLAVLTGVALVEDTTAVEGPLAGSDGDGDGSLLDGSHERIDVVGRENLVAVDRDDLGSLLDEVSLAGAGSGGVRVDRSIDKTANVMNVVITELLRTASTSAFASTMLGIRCAAMIWDKYKTNKTNKVKLTERKFERKI
jgi:hypothetical protein